MATELGSSAALSEPHQNFAERWMCKYIYPGYIINKLVLMPMFFSAF